MVFTSEKINDKQDVELQTARVQLQRMTSEEKDNKIRYEVLSLEQSKSNNIENDHNVVEKFSVEEIRKRQESVRNENAIIYQQIKHRYMIAENAVIAQIKTILATKYIVNDNVKINNFIYDAVAVSKDNEFDYIFEVKYLFSSTSWNSSSQHSILCHIVSQVDNYTHVTGRSAKAVLLIVTLEDQVNKVIKMIERKIPEYNPTITVYVIDEKHIRLLRKENIM